MRVVLMIVLLTVTSLLPVSLEAAVLNDVVRALETPFRAETSADQRIYDYEAAFSQEALIVSLDRLQRAHGRVVVRFDYQRAGTAPLVKFRWQYDQPTTQEIVSDGATLWVYLPENRQVIQSDIEMLTKQRQNDPMSFLTGLGNLSRDFSIDWAEPNQDTEGNYVLDLKPVKPAALISRLVIVVNRSAVDSAGVGAVVSRSQESSSQPAENGRPKAEQNRGGISFPILSTMVYDPNGNSTLIEFSDLKVNRGVSPKTFEFTVPDGVQVIRPTDQEMGY